MKRYLKTLKCYVLQRAQPEGSMGQGYTMDEALGFCTKYMQRCTMSQCQVKDDKEDPTMSDEIVEGKGQRQTLTIELRH
jgi:hypothetical protein